MKFPQLFIVVQRRPISYGSNFQPLLDVFTKCTYFFQSKAIVAFTMTFQQSGIPVLNVCILVMVAKEEFQFYPCKYQKTDQKLFVEQFMDDLRFSFFERE